MSEDTIGAPLNQRAQLFAGALRTSNRRKFDKGINKEKHLMHIVGYVKVRLGLRRLNPPRQTAPTEKVTSFSFKNLQPAEQAFQV